MYPFFDLVIAPLLEAASARRVLEIGALRGETTTLLLDQLGPDSELHVIDPAPQFDPTEHEQAFPGRYVFHRETSHAVLPKLPALDAALIDGDHNWHTVHEELRLLAANAEAAGGPLPLLIMHDVLWPYGRRDLYYAPERIPPEYRQPYERAGMRPGESDLLAGGRCEPHPAQRVRRRGERNGVMTALDDFVASYPHPLRVLVLPIYFGLAIVVDERRLQGNDRLSEFLQRFEVGETAAALLELGESLRLQGMVNEHNAVFGEGARRDRAAARYLQLLKGALSNEHYLEYEVRLEYLAKCIANGEAPEAKKLRDPAFHLRSTLAPLKDTRRQGTLRSIAPEMVSFPATAMGRIALDHLEKCLEVIRAERVAGDLVACGVGRGGPAILMRGFLEAHELPGTRVWVADRFLNPESAPGADDETADLNMVRDAFERFGLLDDRVLFLQGEYAANVAKLDAQKIALLRIGAQADAEAVLRALYGRLAVGGFVVVEDSDAGRVESLRALAGASETLERVGSTGYAWRKLAEPAADAVAAPESAEAGIARPPIPAPGEPCDLSVLVVVHNMSRVAKRTLHSLTREYQRGVDELDYEVIVIENGSEPSQALGSELVESFGENFRYLDLGEESTPSPTHALNRGLEIARGRAIAFMIDGAHVLTPGVLSYAMEGMELYRPAVVATQQWYVGPGQQVDTTAEGYDEEYEDLLFDHVDWPADGYRMFEIGHFIGVRDWFDGMWESNCLFVPRELLEQVGALDESFSIPGGGFVNLDLFERVIASPGVTLVSILGEATFHQVHGGTTTNEADSMRRFELLGAYQRQYTALRGKPFRADAPFHYVGSLSQSARRTRPRRMGAEAFTDTAHQIAADDRPDKPAPLPAELQSEFTEAYWRSFRWQRTRWMGRTVPRCPADLLAYSEIISEFRPDWIVDLQWEEPSAAVFLASICELVGHGRVLAVGPNAASLGQGERLETINGDPTAPETVAAVRETVGESRGMLVIGQAKTDKVVDSFDLFSPLVSVGSTVIFEGTVMNGHPVWPGHGEGPAEAVARIVGRYHDFAQDPRMLRLAPTFNPHGYLTRRPAATGGEAPEDEVPTV